MAEYSKYSRGPGDSILALLEPGEYVLNRNAVDDIGEEKLDEINFEDSPRFNMSQRSNFQMGGMLGDMMGMQSGGSTLSYGGDVSNTQTLDDIYKKLGIEPTSPQKAKFERQFKYDPAREGVIFEDYARSMQGATTGARQNLLGASQAASEYQAKAGFAGSGGVEKSMEQSRGSIMDDFLQQEGAAKSSLFKGVRGERESWAASVAAGLGRLESDQGTRGYTPEDTSVDLGGDSSQGIDLPGTDFTPVASLPTTNQGTVYFNGDFYVWSDENGQYEIQ